VLAAHAAGVPMTSAVLLPTVALVLLASGIPLNVAGWGPREGAAAWAFAATGLGAGAGVTTAVVYGVMALVATLPGLVVLLVGGRPSFAPRNPARVLEGVVRG
jgi:glycosyltransferase 2 family protein